MSSDMIPGYAAASSTRVLGLVVDVYPRISALLQPVRRSLVGVSHSRSFARLTPLICGSGSASWILRPGYWGARFCRAGIGVVGLSFKPHSDDVRDSPALDVAVQLHGLGAEVVATDPEGIENARSRHP